MSEEYTVSPAFSWPSQHVWFRRPAKNKETITAKLRFKMRVECNHWYDRESGMTSGPLVCRFYLKTRGIVRERRVMRNEKNPYLGKQHFFVNLPVVMSLRNRARVWWKLFILLLRYAFGTSLVFLGFEPDSSMCWQHVRLLSRQTSYGTLRAMLVPALPVHANRQGS